MEQILSSRVIRIGRNKLRIKNLYSELSEDERKKGFVTISFTLSQIEEAMEEDGLFVTDYQNKVIADI